MVAAVGEHLLRIGATAPLDLTPRAILPLPAESSADPS
jgi:hypothetical protein